MTGTCQSGVAADADADDAADDEASCLWRNASLQPGPGNLTTVLRHSAALT